MPIKSRHGGSVSTRRIGANSGVPPPQGSRPTRPHTPHTHYPRCPTPAAPTRAHRPSSAVSPVPFLSRLRTCTHRPLSRRFSRAVPLAPTHLHPPPLVPPFLPHLRPHRAHGATPHDRPDAPLSRRSPAPSALAALSETARLPAEVLKLQAFSFLQSISNSTVSFPNLSKKDVKGLLSRKQPRTGGGFRLLGIGKQFKLYASPCRT